MRRLTTVTLATLGVLLGVFLAITAPAAAAHSDPVIINGLDQEGRYLERSDGGLDAVIDEVNADNIAFAWLNQGGDSAVAVSLADDYVEDLVEINSDYHTVVVLTSEGFAASSTIYSQAELDAALDQSFEDFRAGNANQGLETFGQVLTGALAGTTATTTGQSGGTADSGDSGGGIGFGTVLLAIAAAGGAFLLFKRVSSRRKLKKQTELDMEEDRAEIKEQLKNNADRVISLGDKVIAADDRELIAQYEEASTTYTDVSQSVDGAATPEEVDALDDRIDHAEWQFEVIEAKLDGRPAPRSPEEREAAATRAAVAEAEGAPAPSGSLPPPPRAPVDSSVATSPRTGRQYPRTGGQRRRSGMGGMGGMLAKVLGSLVLGGMTSGRSRRSQRRSGGLEDIFGGSGGGLGRSTRRTTRSGGGLGGGVLRRGGSGSVRRSGSRTNSSGRSRTRSRSRGGRSF